jgi:hypothetical protein
MIIILGGLLVSLATIRRRSRTISVKEEINLLKGYKLVQGG